MTVTGIKEAGHTEIQPLLCRVAEAVAVMNQQCESCLANERYKQRSSAIATEPHLFHTQCVPYQVPV